MISSRCFILSISSGFIASILLFLFILSLFILYFAGRDQLRYYCDEFTNVTHCDSDLRFFGAVVPDPVFPSVMGVSGLLVAVPMILLGHLTLFHYYLICIGTTTYDYIRDDRSTCSCCRKNRITPNEEDEGDVNSIRSNDSAGKTTFGRTPPPSEVTREDYDQLALLSNVTTPINDTPISREVPLSSPNAEENPTVDLTFINDLTLEKSHLK
jgi:hypothetical protein